MQTSALRIQIEDTLRSRFASILSFKEKTTPVVLPTGVAGVDIPRGTLTEIFGSPSSGKTSLVFAALARTTRLPECCVLIDGNDSFDPVTGSDAGIDLSQLLWIQCGGNAEHALKAADLVVHSGGFGMVVLDLASVPPKQARRISLASWFRLRHAVEKTDTALVVIERELNAGSCSTSQMEVGRKNLLIEGSLLHGLQSEAFLGPRSRAKAPCELRPVFKT